MLFKESHHFLVQVIPASISINGKPMTVVGEKHGVKLNVGTDEGVCELHSILEVRIICK
jgi:hypothetical protein